MLKKRLITLLISAGLSLTAVSINPGTIVNAA